MDPLWSETWWSTFKYFIILIISTNYIFVHLLDNKVFNVSSVLLSNWDSMKMVWFYPKRVGKWKLNYSKTCTLFVKMYNYLELYIIIFFRGVREISKSDFSHISTDFLLYILLIILPFCILFTSTTFYFPLVFCFVNIFLNRKNQMYHAVSAIMTMRYSTT